MEFAASIADEHEQDEQEGEQHCHGGGQGVGAALDGDTDVEMAISRVSKTKSYWFVSLPLADKDSDPECLLCNEPPSSTTRFSLSRLPPPAARE